MKGFYAEMVIEKVFLFFEKTVYVLFQSNNVCNTYKRGKKKEEKEKLLQEINTSFHSKLYTTSLSCMI